MEGAAGEDAAAQAGASAEPFLGAGSDGDIHPVAGFAFLDSGEADALEFELMTDAGVEIDTADEGVASGGLGLGVGEVQFPLERVPDFHGKEGDLALVVFLVVEKAIASETPAGDAFHGSHRDDGMIAGGFSVVAEEIMAG